MSLINDALKRVGQKKPAQPPGDGIPLQPAPSQSANGSSSPALLILVVVVVLGAGGWYGWNYYKNKKAPAAAAGKGAATNTVKSAKATNAPARPATGAKTNAPASAAKLPAGAPPKADLAKTTTTAPATPAPGQPKSAAQTAAAIPESTSFKLQAIFYRLNKPSAVINGTTVHVGDTVKDSSAKVAAIERTNVTLEVAGHPMVLSLK